MVEIWYALIAFVGNYGMLIGITVVLLALFS